MTKEICECGHKDDDHYFSITEPDLNRICLMNSCSYKKFKLKYAKRSKNENN